MIDAYQELMALSDELDNALNRLESAGIQLAENERDYRIMVREEILKEREARTPVTIMSDIVRGKEEIANARRHRDCSETVYKASQEAINVSKLKIKTLNDQINRE